MARRPHSLNLRGQLFRVHPVEKDCHGTVWQFNGLRELTIDRLRISSVDPMELRLPRIRSYPTCVLVPGVGQTRSLFVRSAAYLGKCMALGGKGSTNVGRVAHVARLRAEWAKNLKE